MIGLLFSGNISISVDGINNKEDAALSMQDLMGLNVSYNNFSNDDQTQYEKAFNVFDEDHDGYLNETEFSSYFKLELLSIVNSFRLTKIIFIIGNNIN